MPDRAPAPPFGLHERRGRLNIFLPANDAPEREVVDEVITLLKGEYKGFTLSTVRPVSFVGWYQGTTKDGKPLWMADQIVLVVVDSPSTIGTEDLDLEVEIIRLEIARLYQESGSPQQSIWIVGHEVWRAIEPGQGV